MLAFVRRCSIASRIELTSWRRAPSRIASGDQTTKRRQRTNKAEPGSRGNDAQMESLENQNKFFQSFHCFWKSLRDSYIAPARRLRHMKVRPETAPQRNQQLGVGQIKRRSGQITSKRRKGSCTDRSGFSWSVTEKKEAISQNAEDRCFREQIHFKRRPAA